MWSCRRPVGTESACRAPVPRSVCPPNKPQPHPARLARCADTMRTPCARRLVVHFPSTPYRTRPSGARRQAADNPAEWGLHRYVPTTGWHVPACPAIPRCGWVRPQSRVPHRLRTNTAVGPHADAILLHADGSRPVNSVPRASVAAAGRKSPVHMPVNLCSFRPFCITCPKSMSTPHLHRTLVPKVFKKIFDHA